MITDVLNGKTALITGASSGLGADLARQLAAYGCDLILVARRMERLQELRAEILAACAVTIDCHAIDLSVTGAPQRLFEQLQASGRQVDVLVNNAGIGLYGQVWTQPWEQLHAMLELDLIALTHLTRLFTAGMVARKFGYILQVASTGAFQPTPTYAVYAAAKSYVLSFGEALQIELRQTGVSCTVVCPGATRTEFFETAGHGLTPYQRATMMDSATVARIGLAALLRRRSSVVPGWLNAAFALATRLLPRQVLATMAYRVNQ
jgi:uncharacterized protein